MRNQTNSNKARMIQQELAAYLERLLMRSTWTRGNLNVRRAFDVDTTSIPTNTFRLECPRVSARRFFVFVRLFKALERACHTFI